uniref:Uncharacterized protein n=1 Tax=Setaria viridis TaxID=4556 RepID=A0A4U6TP33_SETVI|nr:hypothetical protein SEVIR_7G053909v2 [Setaria viridis]
MEYDALALGYLSAGVLGVVQAGVLQSMPRTAPLPLVHGPPLTKRPHAWNGLGRNGSCTHDKEERSGLRPPCLAKTGCFMEPARTTRILLHGRRRSCAAVEVEAAEDATTRRARPELRGIRIGGGGRWFGWHAA